MNIFIRTVLKLDPRRGLITKRDAQMPDGEEVEIYDDEQLKCFFAAYRPHERLLFQGKRLTKHSDNVRILSHI